MNKLTQALIGIILGLLLATPAVADDTDIYIAGNPLVGKSNVLISIDTSGSMLQHVINFDAVTLGATSTLPAHPKYDPSAAYAGNCVNQDVFKLAFHGNTGWDSYMMPYVRVFPNNINSNTTGYVQFVCVSDINNTIAEGLAQRTGAGGGFFRRNTNTIDVPSVSCPTAQNSLSNLGYFQDTNNACGQAAYGDDDLYVTGKFLNFVNSLVDVNGIPNVGWDNFFVQSRLQIVKTVVRDIINNQNSLNINVGLARFQNVNTNGGIIAEAIKPIIDGQGNPFTATQTQLINTLDSFVNNNSTPLEETYYEASLYFRGANANYGAANGDPNAK